MSAEAGRQGWSAEDMARIGDLTVADLAGRSYDGLRVSCIRCGASASYWFRILVERGIARPDTRIVALVPRFRCSWCGTWVTSLLDAVPCTVADGQPSAAFASSRHPT